MPVKKSGKIQNLALFYMLLWGISPPLGYGTIYRVIFIVCWLIWEFYAIARRNNEFFFEQIKLFLVLAVIVIIAYFADGWALGVVGNLQLLLFFAYFPVFLYYENSDEDTTWIITTMLLLIITWNLCTLHGYTTQRNISRLLAKEFEGAEAYAKRGIGGYGYVYTIMLVIPILSGILIRRRKSLSRMEKLIYFVTCVTSIMVVFQAGYSIAVILTVVGIMLLIFIKKMKRPVLSMIVLLVGTIILFINLDNILIYISPYTKGTMYEQKVIDMILSLEGDQATGTLEDRILRYTRSIALFFDSPVWGQLTRENVGKHSAIIDRFAQFGCFVGGAFTYYLLKCPVKMFSKHYDDGIGLSVLFITIGFFLLNNIAKSQAAILFILYPVIMLKTHFDGALLDNNVSDYNKN